MTQNSCDQESPSSAASDDPSSFEHEFLEAHNERRRQHAVPELKLSNELCIQAQKWAEKLATRKHMAYCEMAALGIGENITFFPSYMTAHEIVDYWYNEHRKYEFETPGWQAGTNYFTQIIWKSTEEIGVGRKIISAAECENGLLKFVKNQHNGFGDNSKQIVVAFYRPAGNSNRAGHFEYNVPKPVDE